MANKFNNYYITHKLLRALKFSMAADQEIAKAVVYAILRGDPEEVESLLKRIWVFFASFWAISSTKLIRFRHDLFRRLREKAWKLKEGEYEDSFRPNDALEAKGIAGLSGSTFFSTKDGRYLIKSVPRQFEHSFFRDDLLLLYFEHMINDTQSMLIRITDFLVWQHTTIGGVLGLTPTHHIVMENLLTGVDEAKAAGGGEWETYDLKPMSYFFPERDVAGGALATEATKSRLADKFDGKILLDQHQADKFLTQLEDDTKLLEKSNAVDYSLFLIRIPLDEPQNPFADPSDTNNAPEPPTHPPFTPPSAPSFRTGIKSADGKWVYRAAILDFFWAKHKTQPRVMTLLINAYNLFIARHGPMSITTTPDEYRSRFLQMCQDMVEVQVQSLIDI